jgi:dTDP-4-dehydrorhamnose reductase
MILLTGATGYIGQAFAAELRKRGLPFVPLSRQTLDYTRFDVLFNYVRSVNPRFIINAAGFTGRPDIQDCESHRTETIRANTLLPQTIARVCYLTKTPWGHVSSGGIYSGAKIEERSELRVERNLSQPAVRALFDAEPGKFLGFSELDAPNVSFHSHPCSFYSGSKALAEEALQWMDQGYVWRPGPVFDEVDHPRNYLSAIHQSGPIRDGVNSLSHRGDFVSACLDLWERRAAFGTYNVVNRGALSNRQIAQAIQRILRTGPVQFQDPEAGDDSLANGRPQANCILDNTKLAAAGIPMRPVDQAMEAALQGWQLNISDPVKGKTLASGIQ